MDEFEKLTGAHSTADIIARKVIGEFIELTFKSVVITAKLKEWNRLYFNIQNYTVQYK